MNHQPANADFTAIELGSPALLPMLWGLRLVLGRVVWGKMDL
ncbi:MAG: hypothetical protein ACJ72O_04565 [Marmoricola sp.]